MRIWILAAVAAAALGACDGGAKPKAPLPATPVKDAPAAGASTPSPELGPEPGAEPDSGYRWNTAMPGQSVQYGLPESDDRLLRIDCDEHGRIEIGGPAGVDGQEGERVTVTFGEGDAARTLPALLAMAGDGMNFYAQVASDDPALRTLLAGRPLKVTQGDDSWEVPGLGAAAELEPFLQACRASAG
ncbi:hypothetical protein G5B46_12960 [Caulobacter sp. 602-2]|uniref:Lipoprotein n=1 Tax=Caulobacter sp. 602-2 TaxID=2710887 RepID=A0A6G4QYA4_9CAUL|nr:hypothetical protein [Caulobacter sp. 602-2]NGM50521.1 hypothetical protein [Caulobacter sp. 602-2]